MSKEADGCKVFVINQNGEILLLWRTKTAPSRADTWDLPGGWVDDNESAHDACLRELQEEAGISPVDLKELFVTEEERSFGKIRCLYALAHVSANDIILSYEHNDYKWVKTNQFLDFVVYEPHTTAFRHAFSQ